jgi:lipopolysaccharide export system permease protein
VIKKLDKLIIKAFVGPFWATFFIALFILIIQFFWLYIDDFVGKGIDFFTLIQFIGYLTATVVPLALPLGVLLSSIMTFGNLGETFELMAIKSAGIPLSRFMRPIFAVSGILTIMAFLFANYVIPVAELKMRTLLYDIRVAKPAFDIKEGIFYDKLGGYTIKIGEKTNDSVIKKIIIYEHSYNLQDPLIIAEEGLMTITPNQQFLLLNLKNGYRYQEKGANSGIETEFYRIHFKEYKKVFDLSSFRLSKSADSTFKSYYKMLSYQQLDFIADSLSLLSKSKKADQKKNIYNVLPAYLADSLWKGKAAHHQSALKTESEKVSDALSANIYNNVSNNISMLRSQSELMFYNEKDLGKEIRLHRMEQHRKFSLSFACIIFFLIGAPLGSITRKGGLGMPLVISVLFFILFHILNTSGEKMVKEGVVNPAAGMWFSAMLLIPIGIFLMYKARKDAQPFNPEIYIKIWTRIKRIIRANKTNPDTD